MYYHQIGTLYFFILTKDQNVIQTSLLRLDILQNTTNYICHFLPLYFQIEKIYASENWETILPMTELKPGYENTRYHYFPIDPSKTYTHLRLNIFPDGGIARIRTYGVMVPPTTEKLLRREIKGRSLVDLVAMENGGVCEGLSDAHYGHPRNLIKRNRGINMADGWETARRQDRPPVLKVHFC